MESKTSTFNRRIIQNFMDIIILKHLKNNHPMSGYYTIKYLHKKFHMLPSAGAVYSLLYSLERKNLIKGNTNQGKRVYKLTNQGKRVYKLTNQGETFLRNIRTTNNHIHAVFSSIFSGV